MDWPFGKMSRSVESEQAQAISSLDLDQYGGSDADEIELKRFFLLRHELGRPITMRSRRMSILWSRFMEDEQFYKAFCNYTFGQYLDLECGNGERDWEFIDMYREKFGVGPSTVWDCVKNSEHFD